jgi:hypothetical protein
MIDARLAGVPCRPRFPGSFEQGVSNHQRWVLWGFIENALGELRPQTYQVEAQQRSGVKSAVLPGWLARTE